MRWRRNADEGRRRRERGGLGGGPLEAAQVLVDRMRSGELPRWRLELLRMLRYEPAVQLLSWDEFLQAVPAAAREAEGVLLPRSTTLLHYARNVVPAADLGAVILAAGVGQAVLLERLLYRPMVQRMVRLSRSYVSPVYHTTPHWVLSEIRGFLGDGAPVGQSGADVDELRTAAETLRFSDFGGELCMGHYLNGLAELLRTERALTGRSGPEARSVLALAYSVESDRMFSSAVSDAAEAFDLGTPELGALIQAVGEEIEGWRPGLSLPMLPRWDADEFLFTRGSRPYLIRWLLA